MGQPPETPSVLKIIPQNIGCQWHSGKVLADCLTLLADVDDLQSAVCILIALGERRNDLPLDETIHVRQNAINHQFYMLTKARVLYDMIMLL